MIIIDQALKQLEQDRKSIRVGMIGAGFQARGIAIQIANAVPGINIVAISNRDLQKAINVYNGAGIHEVLEIESTDNLDENISNDHYSVMSDPSIICKANNIDAILEVSGTVEFAARVILEAINNKKHIILMNAEVDGTVGPILKSYADDAGVIITNADGDQPGVTMNLYRFVMGIGIRPILCGNIKGLHDPYRNPTTQKEFADIWGQNPYMVTSFADGTKISFEQTIVANATGMRIGKRGMFGPTVKENTPITESAEWYDIGTILKGPGIVDYVVGATPSPGVFVLGTHNNPIQQNYLKLYKLGSGPVYCFYTPYHLCHFEVHNSIARAVLFSDAAIAPAGAPQVDVVATAKTDLKAGKLLDGIGGYMTYGQCENYYTSLEQMLLPIGLAEGCLLKRDILKNQVIKYEDIEVPDGRISDGLRDKQNIYFKDMIT